ncbi:MAG: hypothetical protein HDT44_09230 [Ruminococcaceae bacterium]|nr:hypothetical protein [Oscillospiraceae bacterium]
MASFTFDRPLRLDEESAEKFFEIASKPAKPCDIKPYSDTDRKESEELLKKYWFKARTNKAE